MSAVLTLRALAMSLMVTEAKLRSAKRSSEAVRDLSRALRSSPLGLAGAARRTVLPPRFLRSVSLFSSWVIRPFSDFIHRPGANAAGGDLAGMTAIPAINAEPGGAPAPSL